jgi:hypothetical protein
VVSEEMIAKRYCDLFLNIDVTPCGLSSELADPGFPVRSPVHDRIGFDNATKLHGKSGSGTQTRLAIRAHYLLPTS